MNFFKGTLCLLGVSILASCKTASDPTPTALSSTDRADVLVQRFQGFCSTAPKYLQGKNLDDEIKYLCETDKDRVIERLRAPYAGEGKPEDFAEITQFEDTPNLKGHSNFATFGVISVAKNLKSLDVLREKLLNLGIRDPNFGVSLSRSVDPNGKNGFDKTKDIKCYNTNQKIKVDFLIVHESEEIKTQDCFYSPDPSISVNYQVLAPNEDQSKRNKVITIGLQIDKQKTVFISYTIQRTKNHGMPAIARNVIKSQTGLFVTEYFKILNSAANMPDSENIDGGADAASDQRKDTKGDDWSWGFTKLSCAPGTLVTGVRQNNVRYELGHPKSILTMTCDGGPKTTGYSVVKIGYGVPQQRDLRCANDDEVTVGISFYRYNDRVSMLIDSPKAMLCGKLDRKVVPTKMRDRTCNPGEFLTGLKLVWDSGLACTNGAVPADAGQTCYTTAGVYCAK